MNCYESLKEMGETQYRSQFLRDFGLNVTIIFCYFFTRKFSFIEMVLQKKHASVRFFKNRMMYIRVMVFCGHLFIFLLFQLIICLIIQTICLFKIMCVHVRIRVVNNGIVDITDIPGRAK